MRGAINGAVNGTVNGTIKSITTGAVTGITTRQLQSAYIFGARRVPSLKRSGMRQKIRAAAQNPVMRKILYFFSSIWYPVAYAVLALVCSFTGMEIAFYALTVLAVAFTCIFSRDSKPLLTPVFMAVYAVSWTHTPQPPYSSQFFYDGGVQIYLLCLGLFAAVCMVFRFIVFPQNRNFFKESKLRLGILLMTAAFLLNGVFFGGYNFSNLPFGLLMALSFFAFYIFFYNTLHIDEGTGPFVGYLLVLTAGIIFVQLAKILLFDGVFAEGSANPDLVIAGWGMKNNVGGMLAMFFPACFYAAYRCKRGGWAFYVLGFIFFGGVCLSQSRASALVGGVILVAAAVYMSISKSPVRRFARIFNICIVLAAVVFVIVFWDAVRDLFAVFFERGFDDSGRFELWANGIRNFLRAPVFGVGFYEPLDEPYNIENWVFPEMYHNIFIQLLASCGIFGLIAYVVHILQVTFAVRRDSTPESLFYIVILVTIFGLSLLDNHIFHVFPAMVYSVFLLLSEREGEDGPLLLLRPLLVKLRRKKQPEPEPEAAASGSACKDKKA